MRHEMFTANQFQTIYKEYLESGLKILHMECGGLVIYHMELEKGCFNLPVFDQNTHTFQTIWRDLMMIIQDITTDKNIKQKRRKNLQKSTH